MRLSSLAPLALLAALIPQSYAWGAVGHEIVATVAEMHLHPDVLPKLCAILVDDPGKECHLAPVAAWADSVRRQGKYRWTAPLHYIGAVDDFPSATCAFPGAQGWAGRTHINVLNAIRNTTHVLQEYEASHRAGIHPGADVDTDEEEVPSYVQDALKFLIHFVGDMHQPLHLTGRDRGGNGDKVQFDGRTTNLHSVWDSLLISERLRTLPRNYTHPLPLPEVESFLRGTIYDPYIRRLVWEGLLGKWHDEPDAWLACPADAVPSARPVAWQFVLSKFLPSSSAVRKSGQGKDGGLGVDDEMLCPYAWAKPIHQLNCDIVFPEALDELYALGIADMSDDVQEGQELEVEEEEWEEEEEEGCGCGDARDDEDPSTALLQRRRKNKSHYLELYTPEYTGVIKQRWIVERLLTQAGVRLAAVLNWIFAEPDGEGAPSIVMIRSHSN